MNKTDIYYKKYIKYKQRYLQLKGGAFKLPLNIHDNPFHNFKIEDLTELDKQNSEQMIKPFNEIKSYAINAHGEQDMNKYMMIPKNIYYVSFAQTGLPSISIDGGCENDKIKNSSLCKLFTNNLLNDDDNRKYIHKLLIVESNKDYGGLGDTKFIIDTPYRIYEPGDIMPVVNYELFDYHTINGAFSIGGVFELPLKESRIVNLVNGSPLNPIQYKTIPNILNIFYMLCLTNTYAYCGILKEKLFSTLTHEIDKVTKLINDLNENIDLCDAIFLCVKSNLINVANNVTNKNYTAYENNNNFNSELNKISWSSDDEKFISEYGCDYDRIDSYLLKEIDKYKQMYKYSEVHIINEIRTELNRSFKISESLLKDTPEDNRKRIELEKQYRVYLRNIFKYLESHLLPLQFIYLSKKFDNEKNNAIIHNFCETIYDGINIIGTSVMKSVILTHINMILTHENKSPNLFAPNNSKDEITIESMRALTEKYANMKADPIYPPFHRFNLKSNSNEILHILSDLHKDKKIFVLAKTCMSEKGSTDVYTRSKLARRLSIVITSNKYNRTELLKLLDTFVNFKKYETNAIVKQLISNIKDFANGRKEITMDYLENIGNAIEPIPTEMSDDVVQYNNVIAPLVKLEVERLINFIRASKYED